MNTLPQELLDTIIDHLQGDLTTLSACSLVSHTFLYRSRFHRFARVTIGSPTERKRISPAIARYILDLTVVEYYDSMWEDLFSCTKLQALDLLSIRFSMCPKIVLTSVFPLPALTELKLRECEFLGPLHPNQFLTGFLNLVSLHAHNVRCNSPGYRHSSASPPFSGSLYLHDSVVNAGWYPVQKNRSSCERSPSDRSDQRAGQSVWVEFAGIRYGISIGLR